METTKHLLQLGLTFDDILLLPSYSDFSRSSIDLSTNLTKKIKLSVPFVSAPMDTVTESNLAIALGMLGGIGIIHRNLTIESQTAEVVKVKREKLLAGAAVGASNGFEERVEALIKVGVDVIVVDSAHGFSKSVIDATKYIKNKFPKMEVISGSIATADAAQALIAAGADGLRVGKGPGAGCTTRIISGMGVPQITAIQETVRAAKKKGIPVIADGGIKYSGDMVKALAAGASVLMMGGFFAQAEESPGKVVLLSRKFIPHRFQSILPPMEELESANKKNAVIKVDGEKLTLANERVFKFKEYRGMGSEGAMSEGARIKSEDEFHGKNYKDRVMVAEGVESLVPVKGTTQALLDQAIGGIKSGMYYTGARNIKELQKNAKFIQVTQASLTESHPHDIFITNPGKNYS